MPSDLVEDDVKAFVVVRAGADADLDALRELGRRRASPRFKVPRYVEVVDELPRTPTGRVAKHQLDASAAPRDRLEAADAA